MPLLTQTAYNAIVRQNFFSKNATQIFAASQSALSFQRRYYDATSNFIFPYLTIVVDVVGGVIRGIAWDNACVFCQKEQCLPNTYNFDGTVASPEQASQATNGCYLPKPLCDGLQASGNDVCDLKLYVFLRFYLGKPSISKSKKGLRGIWAWKHFELK